MYSSMYVALREAFVDYVARRLEENGATHMDIGEVSRCMRIAEGVNKFLYRLNLR